MGLGSRSIPGRGRVVSSENSGGKRKELELSNRVGEVASWLGGVFMEVLEVSSSKENLEKLVGEC